MVTVIPVLGGPECERARARCVGKQQQQHRNGARARARLLFGDLSRRIVLSSDVPEPESWDDDDDGGRVDGGTQ